MQRPIKVTRDPASHEVQPHIKSFQDKCTYNKKPSNPCTIMPVDDHWSKTHKFGKKLRALLRQLPLFSTAGLSLAFIALYFFPNAT